MSQFIDFSAFPAIIKSFDKDNYEENLCSAVTANGKTQVKRGVSGGELCETFFGEQLHLFNLTVK